METDRILFAHNWRFALTEDAAAVLPDYNDYAWQPIT